MALQPVQLDTLDWQQMVTAIRTRIVPDSQGKWTLHAPVDPGVTMIELFAWMLDQRIYWMDQVPASLGLANLALLGNAPQPAKAALIVLQLSDAATPARSFPVAPAGMLLQLGDSVPPLIFTLSEDLTVLPLKGLGITVDGIDKTHDLQQCRLVPLIASGESSAQLEFVLSLGAPLPAPAPGQFISLMIDLETAAAIYPEWSAHAVSGIAPPAAITWSYTTTTGATAVFAAAQTKDGTGGLRRSGVVRLPLPTDWKPEPPGADPGLTVYKILLQIESASFSFTPQLRRLKSNVAYALHLWQRTKSPVTQQWLPLPGNLVALADAPSDSSMEEYPPIENTVQLQLKEQDGVQRAWQPVSDLSRCGPTDRVFVVNRAASQLSFGDGLTGRLPVTSPGDVSDISVSYQAGGGIAGNVGEGMSWEAVASTDAGAFPGFSAINVTAGDGGAESETLAAAIERAAAGIHGRNRAVSKADYENLAQTTPGVGLLRAFAAVGHHPNFPCSTVPGAVTVFVVPYAPRAATDGNWAKDVYDPAPVADPGALQAVRAVLASAKLIGGDVFVCPAVYRPVWLSLTIAVDAPLVARVRQAMITGLQNFLDPLIGGVDAQGWPFGDPLRPSALLRVAQSVLGSAGDVLSVSVRIDSASAAAQPCNDVAIRPFELVNLVHVDLPTQQRPVPSGGLR
jgi:predicted phage baseplate assembly protein